VKTDENLKNDVTVLCLQMDSTCRPHLYDIISTMAVQGHPMLSGSFKLGVVKTVMAVVPDLCITIHKNNCA